MTITSDFNQFCCTYHKNNGSTNPLDERVIKQTRKDDIIYFDEGTKKFSYTKKLCVGLLPQDLEEDIAKMIHMYQFKKNIFIPVSPYFSLGKGRPRYLRKKKDLRYTFPNHHLIDTQYTGKCSCNTKKVTRCKSRATDTDNHYSIGFIGYIPEKYDCSWKEEGDILIRGYHPEKINQTTHLCKTHSKMIRKNVSRMETDADRCYHEYYYENKLMQELGWNYKTHHGYLIKTK